MGALRWSGLILLLLLLGAPAVRADEGEERHAAATAAEKALEALKLRMDARIKEGELLAKAGRLEEALEAYRSVGALYEQGMAEVRALIATLGRAAPAAVPVEPTPQPPLEGPRAGGAFRGRGGSRDLGTGGSKRFDDAVDGALRWLAAHQSPNGSWEAAGFAGWCDGKPAGDASKRPDGFGKALYDPGVTGLALCAFLGGGYTDRGRHPFAKVVSRGLRYLKNIQDPEGCFGRRRTQQYIYNHAIAALAMVEAYGMTDSPVHKVSAQRALDFAAAARNPYMAWRYGVKPGDNDTSVTAWMMMSLKSAQLINRDAVRRGKPAPLTIDKNAFDGIRTWLDKVTDPDSGRVGYIARGSGPARPHQLVDRFPGEKSESMTAAGMLARIFLGEDPSNSRLIKLGADLCAQRPPVWNLSDGSIDMYYWYYGTLAMFQVGGKHWDVWRKAMQKAIVETQRQDTDHCQFKGSWDPVGPWGLDGGRVYSTAMMALCSQVFYRYDRVWGAK